MWISNTIIALILLALALAGAWRWYDSHLKADSKNQMLETASRDVRETAECHLEAFKLRPGLTETDLEVQAAFMDICMEARGYVFLPGCTEATPNAERAYNLGYKFNSICWRKN
jgi:type II secretory pathway component PulJ